MENQTRIQVENLEQLSHTVEKRHRLRVVMTAVPALIGALLWLWINGQNDDFFYTRSLIPKDIYLLLLISCFGVSALSLLMTYLQTGFKKSIEFEIESDRFRREADNMEAQERASLISLGESLRADMATARDQIDRALKLASNVGDAGRDALINDLKMQIRSETSESIISEIKEDIKSNQKLELQSRELYIRFEESRLRLSRELESLGFRGNLNLSLGAVTTVIGLSLLGISVFQETTSTQDFWGLAIHFLPRLTLVLMIELFAYFFLSLYKSSLQEIKYFQNELTNIELKHIALRSALNTDNQAIIASTITSLASTERNHILSKDQTTVELEKAKIERSERGDIAKYIAEFFQKKE